VRPSATANGDAGCEIEDPSPLMPFESISGGLGRAVLVGWFWSGGLLMGRRNRVSDRFRWPHGVGYSPLEIHGVRSFVERERISQTRAVDAVCELR